MFSASDVTDADIAAIDLSEQRLAQVLGDIKRNSRNRRISMVALVALAAAVLGAMVAAPPQHGGLALVADAETPDPQLPRVFGSNGVWRLAEPIEDDAAADPGPASIVEAPTEPSAPSFALSPPDPEDLNSLPTSTSTPPTSTSGQSLTTDLAVGEIAGEIADADSAVDTVDDPAALDWSSFSAVIRIEATADEVPVAEGPADDAVAVDAAADADTEPESSTPDPQTEDTTTTPDNVTVAENPQTELDDQSQANPSTPSTDPTDSTTPAFSTPASIEVQSVLVYSAHVSVTVQVVDGDSSVIDWCNTRVDWGDGSVTRVAGADDAALCTASCEYEAASSATGNSDSDAQPGINQNMLFEHDYLATIDASPRIFVATGDGCSYTLAELQLTPFTVVPLQ